MHYNLNFVVACLPEKMLSLLNYRKEFFRLSKEPVNANKNYDN